MSEEALVDAVEDQCVSVATIARLCELTSVRIYQLSSRGVLPPIENGLLPLAASLAAYIKYLRGFSEFESAGVSTFASERTRLYRLRADAAELDKHVRMGALAPIDKIEQTLDFIQDATAQAGLAGQVKVYIDYGVGGVIDFEGVCFPPTFFSFRRVGHV